MNNTKLHLLTFLLLSGISSFGQTDFVTVWDLSKPGTNATQIKFNSEAIDWVEYTWKEISPGSATGSGLFAVGPVTITSLPAGSIIELRIQPGTFRSFRASYPDSQRMTDVKQWGSVRWASMLTAFSNCINLGISATDLPDLSFASNMNQMFVGCTSLNGPSNIGNWNVSNITSMRGLFQSASSFNQPIGKWNMAKVTDMSFMFALASSFNQDISKWNVSLVQNMSGTFAGALTFNQPIKDWLTSNVTNMSQLFALASKFNRPIGNWDVSLVTDMSAMFNSASDFNQDIHSWDVTNVTRMASMFQWASSFNQPMPDWDVFNVRDMSYMFFHAGIFNQSLEPWAGKLNAGVSLLDMLTSSGLSVDKYDGLLRALSKDGPTGRSLGASGLKYCSAFEARANLVKSISNGGRGWTISGDGSDCSLPVTLIAFSGNKITNNENRLEWVTANEIDFERFEIQRSPNAKSFETIGIVQGENGDVNKSSGVLGIYRFLDQNPDQMAYYRLKMVDVDGSFQFSNIISIQNSQKVNLVGQFYPNPAMEETAVEIYTADKSEWNISTTDVSGILLNSQKVILAPGMNKIQLKIPRPGLNLVHFENGEKVEVRKVIRGGI